MFKPIQDLMQKALLDYSSGSKMHVLLSAKREYLSLAGSIHEDSEEYEAKMNCFNDWFLFHFRPQGMERTVIEQYAEDGALDMEIQTSLPCVNYSVFEFKKINFRKQILLGDLLHDHSISLSKSHGPISVLEKDLFIGRSLFYMNEHYLLPGICTLPIEMRSAIQKQCKKIRKMKDLKKEVSFLLNLEALKTKWIRFGHVDLEKIFVFH